MLMATKKSKMDLWNAVSTTDPEFTREVKYGSRRFTAINSQYQIKRATEMWGPYGQGWGLENIQWDVVSVGQDFIMIMRATFYVRTNDEYSPAFDILVDMPMRTTKGVVEDDICKKLQTECISKALSRLGFNSDVFEGRFDDNKYVARMRAEHNTSKEKSIIPSKPPEPDPTSAGLLGKAAQWYQNTLETKKIKDHIISYKRLCKAVWEEFGKYPTQEQSLQAIYNVICVEDVIEKADFLEEKNDS
jgi:hypothetical protein